MTLGYEGNLYILAFDHRGSFQKKMLGIEGKPTPEDTERISDAKAVIFEGFLKALDEGAPKDSAGMLVDEQFGADLARRAKKEGVILAMPVEKSGQDEFDFEYGDDFGAHIEEFDPAFSKVLVRYNPEGDRETNATQLVKLEQLCTWLHDRDRGVEPDVWKIEGLDKREDCEAVAQLARSDGRDNVACVVLGRGADDNAVEHWLKQGAGVPGYIGFAIGRTIWWDPLKAYLDEKLSREDAATKISANYRHFIDVYNS
jgi:myo-inositol catabolism protein IolC